MTEKEKSEGEKIHDIIIVGGGPAGLSAGLYAIRGGNDTVLLEGKLAGGQLFNTDLVDNYIGFPKIKGYELADKMADHVKQLGLDIRQHMVKSVSLGENSVKLIETVDGKIFKSYVVIYAAGGRPRYLKAPGEKKFMKRGVSYCAVCDGAFFKEKEVAVIGGGDAACEEAEYLTKHVKKLYLIHRRDELRASKFLQDTVFRNPKIEIIWDTVVEEIKGDETVNALIIKNVKTDEVKELKVDGVFVFIGFSPNTDLFKFDIKKNSAGYISVDSNMETSVPGIYAVGDSRDHIARQIAISTGDGATAAIAAGKYLEKVKK